MISALTRTVGYAVEPIPKQWTRPFILDIHYAHRMPPITRAYGLFRDGELVGICTYGSPSSAPLRSGICGAKYANNVLELNRLCLKNNLPNEASRLVGASLKLLPEAHVIISYADTAQNHIGYVYQSTIGCIAGCQKFVPIGL